MAESGACDARADRARDRKRYAERERKVDRDRTRGALLQAAWIFIFLIIWTQLFHYKYFLFFFTKIHDFFFSTNRDLDHLIWTQKKNQVFHSLNLIISFSFEVLVFD